MICKNRIKTTQKPPDKSGVLFFKDTLKSDVPSAVILSSTVILLCSDIVFDSDICPSGKLRIYLNFG